MLRVMPRVGGVGMTDLVGNQVFRTSSSSCERCLSDAPPISFWSRFPRGSRGTQSGYVCVECDQYIRDNSYGFTRFVHPERVP